LVVSLPKPRLVGRDEELAILRDELRRAEAGELRCVLVLADPGVGKTRLGQEFLTRQRGRVLGLAARAHPLSQTMGFGLWAEALERHLRGLDRQQLHSLCGAFTRDLASVLRSAAAVSETVAEHEPPRMRLIEGLSFVLRNLAAERPVAILLDDIHLADASSWQLLHYLGGTLRDSPVVILAAARPAELAKTRIGTELALRLEQEGVLRRLQLAPLAREEIAELARSALGRDTVPSALVVWLTERARGNPLFALGLLHALVDEGADLAAPDLRSVPESLSERIHARIAEMIEPERATLEMLAVVGSRVGLSELVALTARPLDRLGSIIESLVESRLLSEEQLARELTYELAHPLVQEAIYERIGTVRRRALHRLAGRTLFAAGRIGEAAPHFARSAEPGDQEAIDALCEAVRQADARESHREAIAILDALLDLIPEGDERWLQVGDAMAAHASWVVEHRTDIGSETGIRAMRQIDRVLEESGDPAARATTKLRLASFLGWGEGRLEEAERAARDALELFRAAGDEPGARLTENELAWLRGHQGDRRGKLAAAEDLLRRAEEAGDRLTALQATGLVAVAAGELGEFERAFAAIQQSAEIAGADRKRYRLTWSLAVEASICSLTGDLGRAEALLAEAYEDPSHRDALTLEVATDLHWRAGRFADALETAHEDLAWNGGRLSRRRAWALGWAAMAAAEQGSPEARALLRRGEEAYQGRRFSTWSTAVQWGAGVVAWLEGDPGKAVPLLEGALAELERAGEPDRFLTLVDLAEIGYRVGRPQIAADHVERLARSAAKLETTLHPALTSLARGWVALARADAEEAAEAARAAADPLRSLGFEAHRGRALHLLGRALTASDPEAAVEALGQAARAFASCGATIRGGWVRADLDGLGGRGRRVAAAARGPGELTPREREVAALAAEGLTAREIGERLFIGERTVETHLARVYPKLDVSSKVELARRWHELVGRGRIP
jgi:DNA-binding CsgD family transcriptional regulator